MNNYQEFLTQKQDNGSKSGFEPLWIPDFLFDFQKSLTDWAIRQGRGGVFADCGLGKTAIQLVWAENILRKTNKPVLILTPLAVTQQTLKEAEKFGIEAYRASSDADLFSTTIQVTNYEKLHHFSSTKYGGVVCDESSILKNFNGTRKAQITEFMRQVPYRLLCTATAAPNDWDELGTSSEALGYYGYTDMLGKFFTNKTNTVATRKFQHQRDKFRLREYAKQGFWRWVASWARAARNPSDLGFDNDGFVLPPMIENDIEIEAKRPANGKLFDMPAVNFYEEREVVRRTIQERCEAAAEAVSKHKISAVWCHLNDEATLLKSIIPNSIEISGSDSDEKKEKASDWFVNGSEERRVLISKPKIFGYGMNFQHCHHMTYFPTHSYEQYYQVSRRLWRYGQMHQVLIDRIYTNGGKRMLENLERKAKAADEMFSDLVECMNDALHIENVYEERKVSIPDWLS